MEIKAIFFDFDLTLVDTGKIGRTIYTAFSKYAGLKPTEKGYDEYMGHRISENAEKFAKDEKGRKQLLNLFFKIHFRMIPQIKVYGREILRYLKKNKIKIIIISNTSRKVLKKVCKHFNLHYNLLIGDEDMPKGSEKHQAILRAIKNLKLKKSEVFYVGDHINDIKEGKKAGIRVISITTGVFSRKQLEKHKPYTIIKNLNQIKDII